MRPACGWPGSVCSTDSIDRAARLNRPWALSSRPKPRAKTEAESRRRTAQEVRSLLEIASSNPQRTQRQNPKFEAEVERACTIQAAGTSTSCSSWWLVRIVVTLAPSSSDSMVPSQSGPMAKM